MNDFFEKIFNGIPGNHYLTLWTQEDKRTTWCPSLHSFLEKVEELILEDQNLFFGLCSTTKKGSPYNRITSKNAEGLGFIHVDIDYGKEGHKGKSLPPDENKAIEISQSIIPASIIVHSGHGIHAYYLLDEYQKKDLNHVAKVQKDFQNALNYFSEYEVDMTHDLARILRVPGSQNLKDPNNPKPCEVLIDNSHIRYSLTDLEKEIKAFKKKNSIQGDLFENKKNNLKETLEKFEEEQTQNGIECENLEGINIFYNRSLSKQEKYKIINNRVELSEDRRIDPEIFLNLKDIYDPDFEALFRHTKPLADSSNSSYDMALANMMVDAEISEQDICDILLAHRKRYKCDLKLDHPTYYGRTIYKAYVWNEAKKSPKQQRQLAKKNSNGKTEEEKETEKEHQRDIFRDNILSTIGVRIEKIIKYVQDPKDLYEVQLDNALNLPDIRVSSYEKIFGSKLGFVRTFTEALFGTDYLEDFNENISKQQWRNLKSWLSQLVEIVHTDDASHYSGQIKLALKHLINNKKIQKDPTLFENNPGELLIHDDHLTFDAIEAYKIFKDSFSAAYSMGEFKTYLMKIGGRSIAMDIKKKRYYLWRIKMKNLEF